MTTSTPNLALICYNSTTDASATFLTWRTDVDGITTSNMTKIDSAYGAQASQIATLQSQVPIVVAATFSSSNYYISTVTGFPTSYLSNQLIVLYLDTTSNGSVTLNINSLGTKNVMKITNTGIATALTSSDLSKNRPYLFRYDTIQWIWVNATSGDSIVVDGTAGDFVTINSDNTLLDGGTLGSITHALVAKTSPVGADELALSDSAASNSPKKFTLTNLWTNTVGVLISALTAKTAPVGADSIEISDSAASHAAKSVTFTNLWANTVGVLTAALTAKATPVGADIISIADSAASNATKSVTFTNLWANTVGVLISALTAKTAPTTSDIIEISDSAASNATKSVTLSNLYKALGSGTQNNTTFLRGDGSYAVAVQETTTETLTNKRITPRINTITSSATPSINTDTTDMFTITALAVNITSMTSGLSGTPTTGQKLIIRFLDNGTARTIAWGTSFASRGATLPTTTVLGKYLYTGFFWNEVASTWDCVAVAEE